MDDTNKNLSPDLKQAYDRVMNIPVGGTTPPSPAAPQAIPPAPTIPVPGPSITPPISGLSQTPPSSPPPVTEPSAPPQSEGPHTPFLSSVPPHPVSETGTFVFSDKKGVNPAPAAHPDAVSVAKSGTKLSGPIIAVLITVLVIVWTVFWAKFFKIF